MHVAIIGAGALGRIYGVHLATAGERVSFVVRPSRLRDDEPFVIERSNGDRRRREINDPLRVERVPGDADAILLTVRADQLDPSIERLLREGPDVPLVALTPLLPITLERVEGWVDGRCFVAMPTVAASANANHVIRYWSFGAAPTLFERNGRRDSRTVELIVAALIRSALPARLSDDVRKRNPATTIAFFPISVAVSRSGGIDALLRHSTRLELTARAVRETLTLARELGPIEPPAALAGRFVGPRSLRAALRLSRWALPQATRFIDSHFGTKLSEQHRVLGSEILELGRRHSLALPALAELLDE